MKFQPSIIITTLLFLSIACSHLSQEKKELAAQETTLTPEQYLAQLSTELDKAHSEAKKTGEKSVLFLARDLYLKGSYAASHGDLQTSSFLFSYLHKIMPQDMFLTKRYALELIKLGKFEEAEKPLAEVYKKGPKDEQVALLMAGIYSTNEQAPRAEKIYADLLKTTDNREEVCIYYARLLSSQQKNKKAFKVLDQCQKKDSKNGIYSYYKGKIRLSQNQVEKAMIHFQKSLKIDPVFYQSALALGIIYEEKEEWQKSIDIYKSFLKKNPENTFILERLVTTYFLTQDLTEVTPYIERLVELNAGDLNTKMKLGILYTENKEYQKAIAIFKDILKELPSADKVRYYLGALYQEQGNFEDAVSSYQSVPTSSSLYPDAILQLANIFSVEAAKDKSKESAFFHFLDEHLNGKEQPETLPIVQLSMVKASFLDEKNRSREAISTLENFKGHKDFSESHKYYLASLYEKEKRFSDSQDLLWEILKQNPQNAHAWNFLGYSMLERNEDLEKSLEYIQKAVQLAPKDGYIRDSLGWFYYKRGNYQKALEELETARKLVNDDPTIATHLGIIYHKINRNDQAKKFFLEALKYGETETDRDEIYQHLKTLENIRLPASEPVK